jgi:hypothetical protein
MFIHLITVNLKWNERGLNFCDNMKRCSATKGKSCDDVIVHVSSNTDGSP